MQCVIPTTAHSGGNTVMSMKRIFLKSPLVNNFNFPPKTFFQNMSCQTWGVTNLQGQLICRCVRYLISPDSIIEMSVR